MARGEQPPERGLATRELRAERPLARGEAGELGLRGAALGFERAQLAVGLRDGALGTAQPVARLAPARFLLAEPVAQRLDAAAQRRQVLLAPGLRRERSGEQEQGGERVPQVFALPWAPTAATRRSISAGSPR